VNVLGECGSEIAIESRRWRRREWRGGCGPEAAPEEEGGKGEKERELGGKMEIEEGGGGGGGGVA
jgi:hypothetical protein